MMDAPEVGVDLKLLAFAEAVRALYEAYPLPGNPDNPKKAKGIYKVNFYRDKFYHDILRSRVGTGVTNKSYRVRPIYRETNTGHSNLDYRAAKIKVPASRLHALHLMLFP